MSQKYYAPRSCYEFDKDEAGRDIRKTGELSSYRDCSAYVLLGKPGSGKTTAFEQEEEATQPDCKYVSARDFITFDVKPDWRDKTLFIDGLDEVRAGKDDVFSPLDEIRRKLDQLGRPEFRLSCREADWYSASDREELKKVSRDRKIKELFLVELTEGDLQQILIRNHHKTEAGASAFLEEAGRRELTDLIKNPQILGMLVTVVGEGNEWPQNKTDIFKLACEKLLLEEWNQTHNIANRNQTPPSEELMQASGMLCAVMLLARKKGVASIRSNAGEDYPYITDMAVHHTEHLNTVTRTRLFTTRDGHTEYSHRIFAEYLGAYYLSNKIDNEGLPVGRVLALMTGTDGGVVAGLRGVYAWLATLCHTERAMLMQRDPLGVVLYGDVSLFSKEDRLKLLYELSAQAEKTAGSGVRYENIRSFSAFCQADMEREFRRVLDTTGHSGRHQYLIEYILASMTHGKKLPTLADVLVSLLYDEDLQRWNRKLALDVLIRLDNERVLRKILIDLSRNRISDPDDGLMGALLCSMYPERITPSEVSNYLRPRKKSNFFGSFYFFWTHDITEKVSDNQIVELLDALVQKQVVPPRDQADFDYPEMISKLLVKGIQIFGDSIQVERLYGWLSLGRDAHGLISTRSQDGSEHIRKWLEQHPQVQKNLVEYHLDKSSQDLCASNIDHLLFHAEPSEDYGRWCLDKAVASIDESARTVFLSESILALIRRQGNAGLSLELLEGVAEKDTALKHYWDEHRVSSIPPDYCTQNQELKQLRAKQDQDKIALLQCIRNNLRVIEAGTAEPWIFNNLGSAYHGYFIDSTGDTPRERLNNFFRNDPDLIQPVLKGLQRFLYREDIPDVTDIVRRHMEGKSYVYSHPYRAGMDELAAADIKQALAVSEDKIAKALAFNYVDGTGEEPVWHGTLLEKSSELVARIYIEYASMALRAGKTHITGSHPLAFDENYQQVARIAALPLLDSFRTRSTHEQVAPLYHLLAAAIQHAEHPRLKGLIEKKLSRKSMDAAQRTLWLTAGLILDAGQFEPLLVEFVSGKEVRINYLCGLLSHRGAQWSPVDRLPLRAITALIRLLGPHYAPVLITDDDYANGSPSSTSSELIMELISRLATFLTDEATGVIESLLQSDGLSKWHLRLRQTLNAQRSAKREAMFRHANLEQIRATLSNGPPANVADLACLTCERIRELADRIKYGNTNDFQQYWEEYPEKRQHEETCRDRFLSALRPLLAKVNVDAQPEGRYAVDRRADIRVSFGGSAGYNVPIEIKCNDSKDLWHGIRKQLIERYTTDPGAHGYGLYLVFWFGYEKTTPHPESGPKPGTPIALEERLKQLLKNEEERKKISVCVADYTVDEQV